jgi:hypothetical protein
VVGLSKENRETETLAALKHLDAGRLNDIVAIFKTCTNYVERAFIAYLVYLHCYRS